MSNPPLYSSSPSLTPYRHHLTPPSLFLIRTVTSQDLYHSFLPLSIPPDHRCCPSIPPALYILPSSSCLHFYPNFHQFVPHFLPFTLSCLIPYSSLTATYIHTLHLLSVPLPLLSYPSSSSKSCSSYQTQATNHTPTHVIPQTRFRENEERH